MNIFNCFSSYFSFLNRSRRLFPIPSYFEGHEEGSFQQYFVVFLCLIMWWECEKKVLQRHFYDGFGFINCGIYAFVLGNYSPFHLMGKLLGSKRFCVMKYKENIRMSANYFFLSFYMWLVLITIFCMRVQSSIF